MNSTPSDFEVGASVQVRWMGETVDATIVSRHMWSRLSRRYKEPQYRVEIPGVRGNPYYAESELSARGERRS